MLKTVICYAATAETGTADTKVKKSAKPAKAKAESTEIATVNKAALSLDVGPMVISGLFKSYQDEEKAHQMLESVKGKRYDLLAQTTLAIVKAAKADKTIDLSSVFSGDKKAMNKLNDQLGLALGIREVVKIGEKSRIVYAKAVSKYFPSPKDAKGSEEAKRKSTLRSNFIHMLKKCAQAATAIVEKDIDAAVDKESGTLRISGPAVEKQFGAKEVLLNEKQTVALDNGHSRTLAERPSFTALAARAAEDRGVTVQRQSNTRQTRIVTDPDKAIEDMAASVIAALEKLPKDEPVSDRQKKALGSIQSAIAKVLAR